MTNLNPSDGLERRFIVDGLELRAAGDDTKQPIIAGYAAVFSQLSEDLGGFREQIAPGAFSKSLGEDIRALFNHDRNFVIGRNKSKTLRLEEDARGLRVEIDPPDTTDARDLLVKMKRGDVTGMSFGFRTMEDHWDEVDGKVVRTLIEVRVFDVSVVTYPAYPQADAAVRSLEEWRAKAAPVLPDYANLRRRLDLLGQE